MKEKIDIGIHRNQEVCLFQNGDILVGKTIIKDYSKNKKLKKLYGFILDDLKNLGIKKPDISGRKFDYPYDIKSLTLEECRKFNLKGKKYCIPCQKIKNWWYMNRVSQDKCRIINRIEDRLWRIQKTKK